MYQDDFDANDYLARYPEVSALGMDAREHFSNYGRRLGYVTSPNGHLLKNNFIQKSPAKQPLSILSDNVNDLRLTNNPKVIAFYLPQYHEVAENSEWWGEGFTEWTNVRKAKPNFVGHYQPHVPLNKDYYDLSDVKVQKRQTELAKEYGIAAFCYYMYWFDGRRILERPLDQMLAEKSIDHEFCVCWANENWTRTWDGKANDVLLGQVHTEDSDRRFIKDCLKYFRDPRYLRVDGKIALLVYRVDLLPSCSRTAEIWREEVRKAGLGELHLCAVQFYGVDDPRPWGFDAAVEFPPHGWLVPENRPDQELDFINPEFNSLVFDYDKAVDWALRKPLPDYTWYRACFPGWDNTARRQNTGHTFHGGNPVSFERWISAILEQSVIMAEPKDQIVFVNAWNEWGEGAHLEPDELYGYYNLAAVNAALEATRKLSMPLSALRRLRANAKSTDQNLDENQILEFIRSQRRTIQYLLSEKSY